MENATKALRIAANVLIGLLLIALLWYAYNQFIRVPKQQEQSKKIEQMAEFNKIYVAYNKRELKGNKLITLMNRAIDNNKKYEDIDEYKINIKVKNQFNLDLYQEKKENNQEYNKFIDLIKNKFYNCIEVKYDGPDGRISEMTFEEIKR